VEDVALELLSEFAGEPARKVGVRVSNLSFASGEQARLDGWDGGEPPGSAGAGGDAADGADPDGQASLDEFDAAE
jgi:DNA polymerase IV (DinB-like DNA polymerase)